MKKLKKWQIKEYGIYCIHNINTGKKYIGQSSMVSYRLKRHKAMLILGKHKNIHLQRAFNKYGEVNFEFIILEKYNTISKSKLTEREQYFLDKYKCSINENGYNICKVADSTLGFRHSKKSKKIMSEKHKGKKQTETQRKVHKEAMENLCIPRIVYELRFCNYCNSILKKRKNESVSFYYKKKYCNNECQRKDRTKKTNKHIKCSHCGKEMYRKQSHIHNLNFCNNVCMGKYNKKRIIVKCNTCGIAFEKRPSEIFDNNFCSKKCYGERHGNNISNVKKTSRKIS